MTGGRWDGGTGRRRLRWLLLSVPLSLGTAVAPALHAQGIGLSGRAMAYPVTRRVSYLGTVHEQTGTWFGVEGSVRLGRVALGASGLFGKVGGDPDPTTNPDLDVRASSIWLRLRAAPWLELGADVEARRYDAAVGATSWRLIGPTARVTPALGLPGLAALAEVTYFASASVTGTGNAISPALRATFGATYSPPPGRFELRVSYRFERFDFAAVGTNPARLEQFSGILAGVGLRIGRGL